MSAVCTFELHSHFVLIKDIRPAAIPAIQEAVRHQIQFTMEKKRGRFRRTATRVFAAKNNSGTEYRFHINQLEHLYNVFGNKGMGRSRIRTIERPLYVPITAEFKMDPKKVPRDNQVDIINYIVDEGVSKIVTLQTGQGKAQPLSASILTPTGWRPMRDMTVGSKVLTPNGGVSEVTGVYPQPDPKVNYEITLDDGRTSHACIEHLWSTIDLDGNEEVITTEQIISNIKKGKKVWIPLVKDVHGTSTDLPLTTDELGAYLKGDLHDSKYDYVNSIMKDYGFTGSWLDGHIPSIYLHASPSVRLDLLEALAGTTDLEELIIEVYNRRLAIDIQTLVRSLGGLCKVGHLKSDGKRRDYSLVRINFPSEPWVKVKNIKALDETVYMQCISIDDPNSLYITDNYTVTHNTYCGLKGGELIGDRLSIQVLGRYFDKWVSDVQEAYGLEPDRVVAIRGAKKLKMFLDSYYADPEAMAFDVLIFTSKTIQDYMTEFESTGFKFMPKSIVRPEDIYEMLGIGYRIIDEVHQHFHLNYKTDLYTHLPKGLYLSATLTPDDPFIKEMYGVAYPPNLRMDGGKFIKYTHVTSIDYHLATKDKVKYIGPQGSYNHIVYEEWIMADKTRLASYLRFIKEVYDQKFIKVRKPGQKALIFAGSVEMCTLIVEHLNKTYTDVTIAKYTSEDDYDSLIDSDTSVSTLGSAGTAVDIIDLSVCIMTSAVSGSQANIQAVGRLRELKNYKPDNPEFYYFTCLDIDKHVDYKTKKKDILHGRVLTHRSVLYDRLV